MMWLGLSVTLALTGCAAVQNDRLTLSDVAAVREGDGTQDAPAVEWSPRSIDGMDRSSWTLATVAVPADATLHPPAYQPHRQLVDATARQRGEFPSAESAFELREGSGMAQLREAFLMPVLGLWDAVMIVPRMFIDHPWDAVGSPGTEYQRWSPKGPPGVETAPPSGDVAD